MRSRLIENFMKQIQTFFATVANFLKQKNIYRLTEKKFQISKSYKSSNASSI